MNEGKKPRGENNPMPFTLQSAGEVRSGKYPGGKVRKDREFRGEDVPAQTSQATSVWPQLC